MPVVSEIHKQSITQCKTVMANTFVQVNLHIIFHVKSNGILMRWEDLPRIFAYIGGLFRKEGSIPIIVGGMPDHIHAAATLPKTIALSDLMRIVKCRSSQWIKSLNPGYATFAWQDGYGAFSISSSILDNVVNYIRNQKQHHQTKSFRDEYKALLDAYHVQYDERFVFGD